MTRDVIIGDKSFALKIMLGAWSLDVTFLWIESKIRLLALLSKIKSHNYKWKLEVSISMTWGKSCGLGLEIALFTKHSFCVINKLYQVDYNYLTSLSILTFIVLLKTYIPACAYYLHSGNQELFRNQTKRFSCWRVVHQRNQFSSFFCQSRANLLNAMFVPVFLITKERLICSRNPG